VLFRNEDRIARPGRGRFFPLTVPETISHFFGIYGLRLLNTNGESISRSRTRIHPLAMAFAWRDSVPRPL
jgi:hypothetical protein